MTVTRVVLNLIVLHNGRFTFKTKSREFMTSLTEHRIPLMYMLEDIQRFSIIISLYGNFVTCWDTGDSLFQAKDNIYF